MSWLVACAHIADENAHTPFSKLRTPPARHNVYRANQSRDGEIGSGCWPTTRAAVSTSAHPVRPSDRSFPIGDGRPPARRNPTSFSTLELRPGMWPGTHQRTPRPRTRTFGSALRGCFPRGLAFSQVPRPISPRGRVYPRECGAATVPPQQRMQWGGLSPRVRGSRSSGGRRRHPTGSIPASTGQPPPAA